MPRKTKKIEEEKIENNTKVEEIKQDIDKDTLNKEAENIEELKLIIYNKEYTVSQLIEIQNKKEKLLQITLEFLNVIISNFLKDLI